MTKYLSAYFGVLCTSVLFALNFSANAADLDFIEQPFACPPSLSSFCAPFKPAIFDINGDGWQEPFGELNNKKGKLSILTIESMGLQKLFTPGRNTRDLRVADVNGDGLPDIISNTYACNGDTTSQALLFINIGDGTFAEDTSFTQLANLRGFGETVVISDFNNDGNLDIFLPFYTRPDVTNPSAPANSASNANGYDCRPKNGGTPTVPPTAPSFSPSSRLLINNGPFKVGDGNAHFTDVTATLCVDARMLNPTAGCISLAPNYGAFPTYAAAVGSVLPVAEGAQSVDINDDGLIDLYAGSYLFVNKGAAKFVDERQTRNLPVLFDEGAKFIDWNNDGKLDLILLSPNEGPRLFENTGAPTVPSFVEKKFTPESPSTCTTASSSCHPIFSGGPSTSFASLSWSESYGVNAYDLNNDGLEDIVVMGTNYDTSKPRPATANSNRIFLNKYNKDTNSGGFELATVPSLSGFYFGRSGPAIGDINRDGKLDVLYPEDAASRQLKYFANSTSLAGTGSFVIDVLGSNGQRNQQGRVVKVTPSVKPTTTFTRVVDGGSGYMAQNQYPLLVGTPYVGVHTVRITFPPLQPTDTKIIITFSVVPGQQARVYAPSADVPTGKVTISNMLPPNDPLLSPKNPAKLIAPIIQMMNN